MINYRVNPELITDLNEKIQCDLLGMVELYDANCISYKELIKCIEKYDLRYNLKRQYEYNGWAEMIYYCGYNKNKERVYYLPIRQPNQEGYNG